MSRKNVINEIPEEYQRLEYVKYVPKSQKNYLLDGFDTQEFAMQRIENLKNHFNSQPYKIFANVKPCSYAIIIPEEAVQFLSAEEKSRLIEEPQSIQFIENFPIVYRFIEEQYVDEFFKTGALRLSTFGRCKKLEDENRKDISEGNATLIACEDNIRLEMETGVGDNAILLCTSLSNNNIKANGKKDDCCIEIRDINNFTLAITQALIQKGYPIQTVLKGPCIYADRHVEKKLQGAKLNNFLNEMKNSNAIDFDKLLDLTSDIGGYNTFFCKPTENRFENEYRILWLLGTDVTQETYDMLVPGARQYCEKIKFDDKK